MGHVITTYGGGELFTLIFNGIAAVFKQDSTGMILPLIRVGLMVGSVYILVLMLFRQQLAEGFKWFLWVVMATNLIFLPKTTVYVVDPLCKTKSKIDNVPYALGAFASLVSEGGRAVTEKIESVFTLPHYMPYHKTGTVFASSLMGQLGQFQIVDPVFKGNMERFVNQCVVYDAMIGHKYTLTDLQNTPDMWGFVSRQASPVLGFLYKNAKSPGVIVTCKEGAQKLNTLWASEIKKAIAHYGSRVQNRPLTEQAFLSDLMGSARLLSEGRLMAESAQNLLRQTLMIRSLEEGSHNKLSELGVVTHYASAKALLQQRTAYAVAGDIAARTLPLFKNVIEALCYALFIFIVVLALLPNGHRILLTYCGILLWTQLWAPLYAVLNLIMTLYGQDESLGHGLDKGLTLLKCSAILNANADMATLAAWLSVSIPFLSYGIVTQGAGAFVSLATHLGSAMESAASGAASEAVSGNMSLGNISLGTEAYQNTSAFQKNTSPSYSTGSFRVLSSSGKERTTFAKGTALTEHLMSRLGVQIMGTENKQLAHQESLNKASSLLESKSLAASSASESSLQEMTQFLSQVGKTYSTADDLTKSVSVSGSKSLKDFQSYVSEIQQRTGRSYNQAVEIGIAAKAGIEAFGSGINVHGGFNSQAANHKDIATAQSVAQHQNYTENLESLLSAAQSYSKNQGKSDLAELGEGATASFHQAKSLLDQVSIAQNQVDTLSQDDSFSHSQSFTITKDLAQPLLEFIAHQPVNMGPTQSGSEGGSDRASGGIIGYDRGAQILEQGGPEREAYFNRFEDLNPHYKIEEVQTTPGRFDQTYKDTSSHLQSQAHLTPHHHQNQETVLNRDQELRTRKETPRQEQDLREPLIQKVNQSLHNPSLIQKEAALQEEYAAATEQTLGGAAAKNFGSSAYEGAKSLAELLPKEELPLIP